MKPLLIAIEGLGFGPWLGASYIKTKLIPHVQDVVDVQLYSWAQPRMVFPQDRHLIVVGHSFGAAWLCGRAGDIPAGNHNKVITIDPRWTGFDTFGAQSYLTWTNFYQRNLFWFPGCEVQNARNNLVTGVSHAEMPGYPPIIKLIRTYASLA